MKEKTCIMYDEAGMYNNPSKKKLRKGIDGLAGMIPSLGFTAGVIGLLGKQMFGGMNTMFEKEDNIKEIIKAMIEGVNDLSANKIKELELDLETQTTMANELEKEKDLWKQRYDEVYRLLNKKKTKKKTKKRK